MQKPWLVVMAAGLGSRYGGLKQMESVTEEGEIILDFSVFDAIRAGFEDVVFIISAAMEDVFRERVIEPMAPHVNAVYAVQDICDLPDGFSVPMGRTKPWGTCHALLAARDLIDRPFAVINADDYYGRDAFSSVYQFLTEDTGENSYCMAGYYVENTLSDTGAVTRGVCRTDESGYLVDIRETHNIFRDGGRIVYSDDEGNISGTIAGGTPVSMNFWGFKPGMMKVMEEGFPGFLREAAEENPMKAEYLIPVEVGRLLEKKSVSVKVLEAGDRWYGMTYRDDRRIVSEALAKMKADGIYPEKLWK